MGPKLRLRNHQQLLISSMSTSQAHLLKIPWSPKTAVPAKTECSKHDSWEPFQTQTRTPRVTHNRMEETEICTQKVFLGGPHP